MSRNDGIVHRYHPVTGDHLGSFSVGAQGQGVATDGETLFVSTFSGSGVTIKAYNSEFSHIDTYLKPSGMSQNNLIDFAYQAHTGTWFGIVTDGEGGTGTKSRIVIEFTFGGSVTATHTLPWDVDGIGVAGGD